MFCVALSGNTRNPSSFKAVPKAKRATLEMEKQLSSRAPGFEVRAERVSSIADAQRYINRVGFCVLFPVKNVPLPSLYFAVSHRRNARWDKYAQLIWKWKDELPAKRKSFYAEYFRGAEHSFRCVVYHFC